jgi:hypothetical protein
LKPPFFGGFCLTEHHYQRTFAFYPVSLLKAQSVHIARFSLLFILLSARLISFGQGRVVINEFMPWSGCSTTSEFIELLNFGPGPMNIGCYIVTNGQYAVTIPPNTILQPGQYYVLSGQNTLPAGCGNIDSAITADLNWTTCNCTDKPIPTTGDGFMTNGGSSNEKVVLIDPAMNVIDAVSRSSTPSSSVSITTSSVSGGCASHTFNLGSMTVSYESINISTGIDNSYARRVDGDCGWVKTTDISADAPNKTGSSASASYTFTTLNASQCNGSTGSISINVSSPDVASLFPMTYMLAYDRDSNNVFNSNDIYTAGVDSSSPSIDIDNLAYGRYRLTVGSASGCNLQSFDFFIFNCYGVVLASNGGRLLFEGEQGGRYSFHAKINAPNIKAMFIEGSATSQFITITNTVDVSPSAQSRQFSFEIPSSSSVYFRLKMIDDQNRIIYSNQVVANSNDDVINKPWPNPASTVVNVNFSSAKRQKVRFQILDYSGRKQKSGELEVNTGSNTLSINVDGLGKGMYMLAIEPDEGTKPKKYFRFICKD